MTSERVELRARSAPSRCVVCHDDVARTRPASCDACGAVAHRGCARDLARCPTIGCAGAVVSAVELVSAPPPPARRGKAALVTASLTFATALGLFVGLGERPITVVINDRSFADEARTSTDRGTALAGSAEARLAAIDALGRLDPTGSRVDLRPCLAPALEPDARVRAVAAVRLLAVARADARAAQDVVATLDAREKGEPERLVWAILRLGLLEHEARSPGPWVEAAVDAVIEAALAAPERTSDACRDLLRALAPQQPVCTVLLGELTASDASRRALAVASLEPAAEVELVSYRHIVSGSVTEVREVNHAFEALVRVRDEDSEPGVRLAASSSVTAAERRVVRSTGWFEDGPCVVRHVKDPRPRR